MDPEPSLFYHNSPETFSIQSLLVLFFLILCSAIVSGAEAAFFSLSQKEIDTITQNTKSKGKIIARLLEKPYQLAVNLWITNYFLTCGLVIISINLLQNQFQTIASTTLNVTIEIVLISLVVLFFCGVVPKSYASKNNIKFAKGFVYPISLVHNFLSTFCQPLYKKPFFLIYKIKKQKNNFLADQLSQTLESNKTENSSSEGHKILEGIFSYGNTETKQIMCPRMDIFAIEKEDSFATIVPKIMEMGFSRIPVYRDSIDQIEGVLYVKDLMLHIHKKDFNWNSLIRSPFFVPENKKIDSLLKDFQSMKNHLAIVVDEYGGTSGLVSLEDIIEEIVGDISDEFDGDQSNFSKIDDKNYLFEGKTNLKDFIREIEADEELFESIKGEAETLAGFILEIIGHIPKKHEEIFFENFRFVIENIDNQRIKQIKVTLA